MPLRRTRFISDLFGGLEDLIKDKSLLVVAVRRADPIAVRSARHRQAR